MAEFLTRNLKMAISKTPETSYNAIKVGFNDEYLGLLTTGRTFYVPDKDKVDDTGKVGTGREFATEQRSTYITVPSVEIAEELNVNIAAILMRRALGGTITGITIQDYEAAEGENPEVPGIYAYEFGMDYDARQLPSSSCLWSLGGADYIWGGMVVESFGITQTNADVPQMTATLMGSGIHRQLRYLTQQGATGSVSNNILEYVVDPSALANYGSLGGSVEYTGPEGDDKLNSSAALVRTPNFPFPQEHFYMIGAESEISYTPDGETTPTWLASNTENVQRLKNFSFTLTNNHRQDDRRPGDERVYGDSGNPADGHYIGRMNHGDRTIACEATVMLDEELAEFNYSFDDKIIRNFNYVSKGKYIDPNATVKTQAEFGINLPKSYFRTVRGADDNGDGIITFALFPVYDHEAGSIVDVSINSNMPSLDTFTPAPLVTP